MIVKSLNKSIVEFVLLLVALACVFIIILGIQSFAYVINSILLAAMIALGVLPIPQKLITRGMRPNLAFILTLLLVLAVLAGIFLLVFTSLESISAEPPVADSGETTSVDAATESDSVVSQIQRLVGPEQLNQMLGSIVSVTGQIVAQIFVVVMIFIFMLSALIATPISGKVEDALDTPFMGRIRDLTGDVQRYISMTTLVNFLVGMGNAIFLLILDVPFAVLWGLFSWFTGYIPAVGFWIAMIPPVLVAWVTIDVHTAAIVFFGFVVINGSVENFVKPRIMGQELNLPPLLVFISLFFWGWLLGAIGAMLAIPITMMILSVLDSFDATRWVVVLMRSSSSTEEHEKIEASGKLKEMWGRVTNVVSNKGNESGSGDEPKA